MVTLFFITKYYAMKKIFIALFISVFMISLTISCKKEDNLIANAGDTLWVHNIPQSEKEHFIDNKPLAVGTNGTIYYSAGGGVSNYDYERVYAVNNTDGSLKWQSDTLATWYTNSNIVIGDAGNIYVASYTKLYCINPADGSFNWVWEVPQTLPLDASDVYTYGELGPLALANNGDIIIKTTGSGSYYRAMYCIGNDGTVKWYRFIGSENTEIVVGKNGEIIDFEHDDSGQLLTVSDSDNGSLLWSTPANVVSAANNITIADNGDIITLINTDSLIRINPVNHTTIWKVYAATSSDTKTFDSDDNMFLFDQFAGCSVYDINSGNLINSGLNLPQTPLIDTKNQLYGVISDNSPHLSVTDKSGSIIWESDININRNTKALSDDNVIYCTDSKKVYAIQSDANLNKNGWAKTTHDNRNTNNVNKF